MIGRAATAWVRTLPALRLGERLEAQLSPDPHFLTRIGADLDALLARVSASAPSVGELPRFRHLGHPRRRSRSLTT